MKEPNIEIPRIVGTFEDKEGRDISYCFDFFRTWDKGFHDYRLMARHNKKDMGYIGISYIPESNWISDIFQYAYIWQGYCFDINNLNTLSGYFYNHKIKDKNHAKQLLVERFEEKQIFHKNYFVNKPFVTYVKSHEKRKSIATNMYLEVSKILKEYNMVLWESGTQTNSAKLLWDSLPYQLKNNKRFISTKVL